MIRVLLLSILVGGVLSATSQINIATARVDPAIKKRVLEMQGAEAYNEYLGAYGKYIYNIQFRSGNNPDERKILEKKKQREFVKNHGYAQRHNKEGSKYELTVNSFTVLDPVEKEQFLGMKSQNLSKIFSEIPEDLGACRDRSGSCLSHKRGGNCDNDEIAEKCEMTCGRCGKYRLPETLDWNARGYTTAAKSQGGGGCGSCWAFAATGVMEWIHKKTTGTLLALSEQEMLDCAYPDEGVPAIPGIQRARSPNSGCDGGLPYFGWKSVRDRNRIMADVTYPYREVDAQCDSGEDLEEQLYPSVMTSNYSLGSIRFIKDPDSNPNMNTEAQMIEAVNTMPLAVGIYAEGEDKATGKQSAIYIFKDGIFTDCDDGFVGNSWKKINHAVLLTGYGPDYWEIKNSWGPDWGVNGFGKLFRGQGTNMCGIQNTVMYVEYTDENEEDGEPDFPREAIVETSQDDPNCVDFYTDAGQCTYWANPDGLNYCDEGEYISWMRENCRSSCESCYNCDPGHYIDTSNNCQLCHKNTYNSNRKAKICTPCHAGSWAEPGSASSEDCTDCLPGSYLNLQSTSETNQCEACPEDTYSGHGAASCTACPSGTRSTEGSAKQSDCIKPPPSEDCEDAASEAVCLQYLESDECTDPIYKNRNTRNCKLTCGICTPEVAISGSQCTNVDGDTYCSGQALMGQCDSDTSSDIMRQNCAKACGRCVSECIDSDDSCSSWAEDGYCASNTYTKNNCPLSCGFCTHSDGNCEYNYDRFSDCPAWKEDGYCQNSENIDFMRSNCGTTCRLCPKEKLLAKNLPCEADNANTNCPFFAQRGDCSNYNRKFMEKNCATTCGFSCENNKCMDKNTHCMSWSEEGECDSNPYYMHVNCAASCDTCEKLQGEADVDCQDYNEYCEGWAASGECTANAGYMWINCPKSCKRCGEGATIKACDDRNPSCQNWAEIGECENNVAYMSTNCKTSCNTDGCGSAVDDTCRDKATGCAGWKEIGECTRNPAYMLVQCPVSCNSCDILQPECIGSCCDKSKDCAGWAHRGECSINPAYMRKYCKVSCNIC